MKAKLLYDLWKFPPIRNALKKEVFRFLLGSVLGLSIAAFVRWGLDWGYTRDGLLSIAFGLVGIVLLWLVSVVRAVREVLREHSLLER